MDDFNKLIIDLENIGTEVDDEDRAIMSLNSLPKSYSTFVDTMKYARETLSFHDVIVALKSKETDTNNCILVPNNGDSLAIKRIPEKNEKTERKE